jgi:2-polyprenyl-6-methoxyphenol hydroxylase-like FAD-dependent oxidoreductase
LRLAIVGAGICGLTLAAALNRRAPDIALSIFEANTRSDSRAQGYAIGLKDESGLGVLEQLGLRSKLLATGSSRIRTYYRARRHRAVGSSLGSQKEHLQGQAA